MNHKDPLLFALNPSREFGEKVGRIIECPLSDHEEREFEDGEHKIRPLVSVRDRDVYVIQSLHGDARFSPNDKLCRLAFFLATLRDCGAARITAIAPYLCYARKDRKTKPRDPVTARFVASIFEAVGLDRIVTLDVHNLAAFQNAFRNTLAEHLQATGLFARHFARTESGSQLVVVSPDAGGLSRAEQFRQALERETGQSIETVFLEKTRSSGELRGGKIVGDVSGRTAVILDDLIASGSTLARAAAACRAGGAVRVVAAASHGLFTGGGEPLWSEPSLDHVVVTNSVPPWRIPDMAVDARLATLDVAPLFAGAIRNLHHGESLEGFREYLH